MTKKTSLLLFLSVLLGKGLLAQIAIKGPVCVIPGVTYQYDINNTGKWAATAKMKVCIEGGIIADAIQSKRKNCTDNDAPLGAVRVIWNNVAKTSLTISSSAGEKVFAVSITQDLQAGAIINREQQIADTVTIPALISCSQVTGGSCTPSYSYQWEQSIDAMIWSDIPSAVNKDLVLTQPLKQTGYFRRKVTEAVSNTIGYSDIAIVNVNPYYTTRIDTGNGNNNSLIAIISSHFQKKHSIKSVLLQ